MRWMIGALVLAGAAVVGALVLLVDDDPARDANRRTARETERDRPTRLRDRDTATTSTGFTAQVVIEMPDGSPAADADLLLRGRMRRSAVTGADGSGRIEGLQMGDYALMVRGANGAASCTFEIVDQDVDLGTLRLREALLIRGHVYDAGGRPLNGANVEARDESAPLGTKLARTLAERNRPKPATAWATTTADGAYELWLPEPGEYALRASAAGYTGEQEPTRPIRVSEDGVDFHLLPGLLIAGRVFDELSRPVEGALVACGGRGGGEARTDEEGRFAVTSRWGTRATVRVHARGFAPHVERNIAPPLSDLVIQLMRGTTIQFRIVEGGEGGPPVAGVDVALFADGVTAVKSDERGLVTIPAVALDQLPRGRGGDGLRFFVGGGIYAPREAQLNTTEVIDGVMDLGEVVVEVGGVARGRVLDESTRDPVEGAIVRFLGGLPFRTLFLNTEHAVSDRDGRYELVGIPREAPALIAMHPDYVDPREMRELLMTMRGQGKPPLFGDGVTEIEVDLLLEPAGSIAGLVLSPDGEPVAGARVQPRTTFSLYRQLSALGQGDSYTDHEGRFRLEGIRNGSRIEVVASHRAWGDSARVGVTAEPGVEITLRLLPALELSGRVVDEQQRAVAGARVSARQDGVRRGAARSDTGLTDEQGRFTVRGVPAGDLILYLDHPRFKPTQRKTRLAAEEGARDLGDIALTRGVGIEGRVVDENGRPQPGLSVNANAVDDAGLTGLDGGQQTEAERRWASDVTDEQGGFAFYGLKDGVYRLQAHGSEIYSDRPEVRAGTTDVTIVVRRAASLELLVTSTDGLPVPRAAVSARLPEGNMGRGFLAFSYTDDRGRARLYPLPPNEPFSIETKHAGHKLFKEEGVRASTDAKPIRLDPGARIRGRVVDGGGSAVAGASVSASAGSERNSVRSDAEGRFELGGLEVKPYEVRANATRAGYISGDPVTTTPGEGELRLVLLKGESIAGKLIDPEGNPVRQIQVRALDAGGNSVATGWVWQMTGKFELTGLPKGSYTLRFLRGQDIKAELSSVATGTDDLKVTIPN